MKSSAKPASGEIKIGLFSRKMLKSSMLAWNIGCARPSSMTLLPPKKRLNSAVPGGAFLYAALSASSAVGKYVFKLYRMSGLVASNVPILPVADLICSGSKATK